MVDVNYSDSAYDLSATSPTGYTWVVNNAGSPFGAGWDLSYYERLVTASGAALSGTPTEIFRVIGNGDGLVYEYSGGSYALSQPIVDPGAGEGDVEDGTLTAAGGGYEILEPNGDEYLFNSSGYLTEWIKSGGIDTFTFTGGYYVTSVTTPDNAYTAFTSPGIVTTTDTSSMTTTLTLDGSNNLTEAIVPDGTTYDYTYDANHLMLSQTDGVSITSITYANDMVSSTTLGDPITTNYVPAKELGLDALASGPPIGTMTDGLGNVSSATFNDRGQTIQTANALGATLYGYDANGFIGSTTDPLGRTTIDTNDAGGYPTSIQAPDGTLTSTSYDADHDVLTQTDQYGNVTSYTYNADNEVTTMTDPLGRVTTYTYTGAGDLQTTTDPLGHVTTNIYDADRRLVATVSPLGERTTYSYDALGNPATVEDPLGHITTTTYDAGGHLLTSTTPTGATTTYVYDVAGNLTGEIDPDGNRTSYVYDSRGLEVNEIDGVGSAVQRTTTMVYDDAGQLVAQVDAHWLFYELCLRCRRQPDRGHQPSGRNHDNGLRCR